MSNGGGEWISARTEQIRAALRRWAVELWIAAAVLFSCGYFFQGGGWNQNAHFATTVAMVEDGTVLLDRYRHSTGDLARTGSHVVSNKAIGTALAAVPAYLIARVVTLPIDNHGDRVIVRAHLTSLGTSGLALVVLALLLYRTLLRRLSERDAALVALGIALATPLFPNSTMLNSHALVSLCAFAAYALLEAPRLAGSVPSAARLLAAGLLAGLPMTLEYMTVVVVAPLGIYAAWQTGWRWQLLAFAAGCALAATIPVVHHTLVFGHPLQTGYHNLMVPRLANDAAQGFMGFVGPSPRRLFELTFGWSRGFFFLSPFLLAAVPGLVLLVRRRETRPEGVVNGVVAWLLIVLTASLVYWHSGSALGSRYALLFVPFSALPIAALLPRFRVPLAVAMALAFLVMVMAVSVTAIPPAPPPRPPYPNVLAWFWELFRVGNLAAWQERVLTEQGIGNGNPTLPFAYNLGQLLGVPGVFALVPYLVALTGLGVGLGRRLSRQSV